MCCADKGEAGRDQEQSLLGADPSEVHFVDDFEGEPLLPEGEGRACRYGYRDGAYLVRDIDAAGTCELDLWFLGQIRPPVRIEATIKKLEGQAEIDYGLKFALAEKQGSTFYTFTITSDGTFALARHGEEWQTLEGWRMSRAIETAPYANNHVAIELRDQQARLFVNGYLVALRDLPEPPVGYVGFYLGGPGLEVAFDNLTVITLR